MCSVSSLCLRLCVRLRACAGPGKCYRIYTEQAYRCEMLPTAVPEIQRTNLENTVLLLKAMGVNDMLNFDFMDPPPVQDKQALSDQRKSCFHQPEGDHVTYLEIYRAWQRNRFSNSWCFENFVQNRALRRAQDVRKQLITIMDRYKLDIISAGKDYNRI
ncbi:UNVERIFIED_CONTAM: hypothetical protein H355_012382, partial [Colinus virginianus]